MFHVMDAIINSALFALAKKLIYDDLKPAPSIAYFIYIFSIVDCAWCVFQALKSYLFYLYLFCRKIEFDHSSANTILVFLSTILTD